jgi:hypothetical protein
MSAEPGKGRQLEQQVAHFLGQHGYTVSTNLRALGRSGALHELDVVGDKSDGLTSFRLVVECKAWATPIDKEVVYKLAAELADLGAARGVIVTLSGWTAQAAQAAAQANIELWGPAELEARFGSDAVEQTSPGGRYQGAVGTPFAISADAASKTIQRAARGALGFSGDEVAWSGHLWLPVWVLQTAVAKLEGTFRKVTRINRVWNAYNGLDGHLMHVGSAPPQPVHVNIASGFMRPKLEASAIEMRISESAGQWRRVTTEAARLRHGEALRRLGIQVPFTSVSVESSTLTYHPLWIALLRKSGRERFGVVDGISGAYREDLAQLLTAHAHLIRQALAQG